VSADSGARERDPFEAGQAGKPEPFSLRLRTAAGVPRRVTVRQHDRPALTTVIILAEARDRMTSRQRLWAVVIWAQAGHGTRGWQRLQTVVIRAAGARMMQRAPGPPRETRRRLSPGRLTPAESQTQQPHEQDRAHERDHLTLIFIFTTDGSFRGASVEDAGRGVGAVSSPEAAGCTAPGSHPVRRSCQPPPSAL
jgi:hypothetical protein